MSSFPELTMKCDVCGRRATAKYAGRVCALPLPDSASCVGTFVAPTKPEVRHEELKEETLLITIAGMTVGEIKVPKDNPFPAPKVVLSDRAKEVASAAFDDCEKGPRKSMQHAVQAAAGVIAADNFEVVQRGITATIPLLTMVGRNCDADMLHAVVGLLSDFIEALDPDRPTTANADS